MQPYKMEEKRREEWITAKTYTGGMRAYAWAYSAENGLVTTATAKHTSMG